MAEGVQHRCPYFSAMEKVFISCTLYHYSLKFKLLFLGIFSFPNQYFIIKHVLNTFIWRKCLVGVTVKTLDLYLILTVKVNNFHLKNSLLEFVQIYHMLQFTLLKYSPVLEFTMSRSSFD
ncbi:hypothetical protein V8G54_005746 [Vigna mungo]|uniref:Uncharacterized protein n=1 Tax=Vigna mungo TaxID=3915 RepID=A0AAQ3S7D5_VIGMU